MLNRENTLRGIQERMGTLGSSDVCALFLLSIETNAQNQEALNLDAAAERTAALRILSVIWVKTVLRLFSPAN